MFSLGNKLEVLLDKNFHRLYSQTFPLDLVMRIYGILNICLTLSKNQHKHYILFT